MYGMSIIFMIINRPNQPQPFHSNWNNWYNSTSSPCCTPCCTVPSSLLAFITHCGTIPMLTSWQTTFCIRPRNPAGGCRALSERDCAAVGNGNVSMVLVQPTGTIWNFPRILSIGMTKKFLSKSSSYRTREPEQIPANLKCFNLYNKHNTHNRYKEYN